MTQFNANIRKANGEIATSLIQAEDIGRANELAQAMLEEGETVESVETTPAAEASEEEGVPV